MLFDLRGRGRRRAVQAIYLSLALLMGGGLVLFGIGGATSGGLLDAFKNGSGNANVSDVFKKRVDTAERAVRVRPQDPKAWAQLTRVRVQEASAGGGYDTTQQAFTDSGKQQLRKAESAWNRYIKLTKKPDQNVASLMVQAYSLGALNEPGKAVDAMEIIVDSRKPTGPLYAQLAALAYQAGQTRKAELASKKAIEMTPKDQRQDLQDQLDAARAQASASLSQGNGSSSSSGSSTNVLPGG
jgi:tetratricopeptide (TPR) repeat protein